MTYLIKMSNNSSYDDNVKKALFKAVKNNKVKELENLMKKVDWPKSYPLLDYDLLSLAISQGFKKITNILLDNGARVYVKPNDRTPLHIAAAKSANSNDWLDIIKRLVDRGAPISAQFKSFTPLHVAFTVEPSDKKTDLFLRCYLRQSRENIINDDGLSFLHIACSRPHLDIVQKLVESNENSINHIITQSKCSPLHFAVEYGRHEIAEFLIKNGANICSQNLSGSTPLHIALERRDIRMVDIILAHDVDRIDVANKYNLTHFMISCIGTKLDVVKDFLHMAECRYEIPKHELINAKIKDLSDCAGYTALHLAVELGTLETVEFLLNQGADCCAISGVNKITPHVLAIARERLDISKVLNEHCVVVKECVKNRCESPSFGKYSKDYEREHLIECVREIKYLRQTCANLKNIEAQPKVSNNDDDIEILCDSA